MTAPTKLIGGFFLRLLLIYAGVMLLWPIVGSQYAAFFHGFGNALFSEFGDGGRVTFGANPEQGDSDRDTHVRLGNRKSGATGGIYYISRHGYAAIALTIAFILATPISRRRRAIGAIWGLLLIHGFIALRLWIGLMALFSGSHPLAIYRWGRFGQAAIAVGQRILIESPEATYVVPLFIWIAVCLRRSDLKAWRSLLIGKSTPSARESDD